MGFKKFMPDNMDIISVSGKEEQKMEMNEVEEQDEYILINGEQKI